MDKYDLELIVSRMRRTLEMDGLHPSFHVAAAQQLENASRYLAALEQREQDIERQVTLYAEECGAWDLETGQPRISREEIDRRNQSPLGAFLTHLLDPTSPAGVGGPAGKAAAKKYLDKKRNGKPPKQA